MDLHLKDLFTRFQEQFGSGPGLGPGSGACLLKIEGINPSFIKSLYRAAAALYRTDPWKRLRPGHLFSIRVGKDLDWSSRKQLFPYVQFTGGDGGDVGFNMFRTEQDALKMTGSRETNRVPNIETLRVTFGLDSFMFPVNKRMIRSLSLESSGPDRFPMMEVARCTHLGMLEFRNPSLEELRFLYALMKAIALVHPLLQQAKAPAPKRTRLTIFDTLIETVDVQWPVEMQKGWDLVAVTVSHPPNQAYSEKPKSNSIPTKIIESPTSLIEQPKEEDSMNSIEHFTGFYASRRCSMCEKEVQGEQSLLCGRCRAVIYCGAICQRQHWKETHKSICGLYKAMMEREEELETKVFTFPCYLENPCKWLESVGLHQKGMWRRLCNCYNHCPFGMLPALNGGGSINESWGIANYPPDSPFINHNQEPSPSPPILLSGWAEYYNLRCLPFSSPASALLTFPLTLHHIITALSIGSKSLLLKGREVVIHYVGPEAELDFMPAFSEIGHLLNGSGSLQITMVGPEVPTSLSGTMSVINNRVRVSLVRGLYQEEMGYLPSPHVVVALNSGLESCPSWGEALEMIETRNLPAYFTEFSELSCSNAKQVLRGAGLHVTYPVTPNPFRSPVRIQGASINLPSFSNGFVFGVNT
ncbi:hypothetical protein AMTRI_Chr02g214890 [Amborella trichopoda]